jgi:hypothetical protein
MCFLIALAFLGRLSEMAGPSFCLTYHNVHRLFITALVLASKSADDVFHANQFMAQCGGEHHTLHNATPCLACLMWAAPLTPTPSRFQASRCLSSTPSRLKCASG